MGPGGLRRAQSSAKTREPQCVDGATEEPRMEHRGKWVAPTVHGSPRRCAVRRCRGAAVATLRTHPTAPAAWLVDLAPEGVGDDVCAYHADSLRPADGWMLHDTRRRNTRR